MIPSGKKLLLDRSGKILALFNSYDDDFVERVGKELERQERRAEHRGKP